MIGNDIVDLALAQKESNWKRRGYLDKIYTKNEQSLISQSDKPEITIWELWSRKEAAYKIYNRQSQLRGYFPLQLECSNSTFLNGFYYGKVIIKEHVYYSKTEITSEYINTIAAIEFSNFDFIQIVENRTYIKKINDMPFYFDNKTEALKPASISHHGRFEQIICL